MANPHPVPNNQNALRRNNFANISPALRAEYARKATLSREKRRRSEYLMNTAVLRMLSAPAIGANDLVIRDDDGNELTRFDVAMQNAFAIFNHTLKKIETGAKPGDIRTMLDCLLILQDLAGQRNIKHSVGSYTESPLEKLIAETTANMPMPGASPQI